MQIYGRILGRILGWVIAGACYGVLVGVVIGGIFGGQCGYFFYRGMRGINNPVQMGFAFGGTYGATEGAANAALAFFIAALWRVRSPTQLSWRQWSRSARGAWFFALCATIAATLSGMGLGYATTQTSLEGYFFYSCQIGFNIGLFCGIVAPGIVEMFLRFVPWRRRAVV